MNYAVGHAFNLDNLFEDLNTKGLSLTSQDCLNELGYVNKKELAKNIFASCVNMALEDLIENDVQFKLPLGSKEARFKMHKVAGKELIESRQNGKYEDIDILNSNFTAYKFIFEYDFKKVKARKDIYLNKKFREKINEYTNSGKGYS